jgi:hypothetical protein
MFIFPPVLIVPGLNMSKPSAETTNPLPEHIPSYCSQDSLLHLQLCASQAGVVQYSKGRRTHAQDSAPSFWLTGCSHNGEMLFWMIVRAAHAQSVSY